jgi:hypothetical protein
MAVNVGKTKFIIFHTRGKHFDQSIQLTYDDNEPNMYNPDLIHPIERFHSNHPIITNRAYKILGVYLDENLTFDCHTNFILTKLNRSLYCINKVKNILPPSALKSLYFSLIHSHLTYCSNIASCASNSNVQKIFLAQKKAIRIICNKKYREHTNPLFTTLQILPYPKLLNYSKLLFMHSVVYKYCPPSFGDVWRTNTERQAGTNLRNSDQFTLPAPRIELFRKSPLYSLPALWNGLDDTKHQNCKTTFKISLKYLLLNENENQQ